MPGISDMDLVREYVQRQSEEAFAELVQRHVNLVYSVALRYVHNTHDAQDVTQAVFIALARKAAKLGERTSLTGWMYETTRLTAVYFLRTQARRRAREQESSMQIELDGADTDSVWRQLAPLLEEAMARLTAKERELVALRYFENRSGREAASLLGIREAAAHKRTERAVEKIRVFFARRGIAVPAGSLIGALSAHSVHAAPAGLAKTLSAVAMTKGVAAGGSTLTLVDGALKLMAWTKTTAAITAGAILLLAAGTATVTVKKIREDRLERIWRINKDVPAAVIDSLPPMVKVLPTKFPPPWTDWNSGVHGDKFAGARAPAGVIAVYAYGCSPGCIRFVGGEPTNLFDFVATLPHGSAEALQRELKAKLRLVGHSETDNVDVLLLRVEHPNAPGLKTAIEWKHDQYSQAGVYHSSNEPIATGAPRFEGLAYFLEQYFQMPVIDQTGLTQSFSMDLRWGESDRRRNPDGLKQALLDRLGLELVPTNMPIKILVMEKTK